jgi:hypothetical protein
MSQKEAQNFHRNAACEWSEHDETIHIHRIRHVPQVGQTFHRIAAYEWGERDETSDIAQGNINKHKAMCI